jgi:hypothetical protein
MRYALVLSAMLLGLAACVHADTTAPAPASTSTTYVAPAAPVATVVTPVAPPSTTTVIRSP